MRSSDVRSSSCVQLISHRSILDTNLMSDAALYSLKRLIRGSSPLSHLAWRLTTAWLTQVLNVSIFELQLDMNESRLLISALNTADVALVSMTVFIISFKIRLTVLIPWHIAYAEHVLEIGKHQYLQLIIYAHMNPRADKWRHKRLTYERLHTNTSDRGKLMLPQ